MSHRAPSPAIPAEPPPEAATAPPPAPTAGTAGPALPRYREIYDDLLRLLTTGALRPGDRLPSEAELGRRYAASRITITRAVTDLQTQGWVSRRAGSGTHVLPRRRTQNGVFGLLIPDLGRTEIFEPICHGMMQSPQAQGHALLWGPGMAEGTEQEEQALSLAHHFVAQGVSGAFFAPLEFTPQQDVVNERILQVLSAAEIPVVLLDRTASSGMQRSHYDLVGIDNRRAGYLVTEHLLQLGVRRIAFVARPRSANSIAGRIAGYREALFEHGILGEDLVRLGDPRELAFVASLLDEVQPEAVVCGNDLTAGRLMVSLIARGLRIPEDVRIVGVDDVKYANLLPVPLTTQHQNCEEIGAVALRTMLDRVQSPNLPVRDVFIQTQTVVRLSCGAHLPGTA